MKIIILLSAGILILAIILISWKFYCSADREEQKANKEVKIQIKAVIENGKKHLKLYDSHGNSAKDTLTTGVQIDGSIRWELKAFSKIDKIVRIYSEDPAKVIFKEDAMDNGDNVFILKIPEGVSEGMKEKYIIKFTHKDGVTDSIDPYIRIE